MLDEQRHLFFTQVLLNCIRSQGFLGACITGQPEVYIPAF